MIDISWLISLIADYLDVFIYVFMIFFITSKINYLFFFSMFYMIYVDFDAYFF